MNNEPLPPLASPQEPLQPLPPLQPPQESLLPQPLPPPAPAPSQLPPQQQLPQQPPAQLPLKAKWYKRTWLHVLLIILVPPIGLLTMWLLAPWKMYVKVLLTLPLIFTSAVFLLTATTLSERLMGNIGRVGEENSKLETFLEKKYAKPFTVTKGKIVRGGDAFLGVRFTSYKAEVSPEDDAGLTFEASRIIEGQSLDGGAGDSDRLSYYDSYLEVLWAEEIEGNVKTAVDEQGTDVYDFSFTVGVAGTQQYRADFYDAIWGTVPKYSELSAELKQKISFVAKMKSAAGLEPNNVLSHAKTVYAISQAIDPDMQGIEANVEYAIYREKGDREEAGKWSRSPSFRMKDVKSATELQPYFVKWTDGKGQYYNMDTKQFDLNWPVGS